MIDFEIEAILRNTESVLFTSGQLVPITNWIDQNGDDCPIDDAVACVADTDTVGWFAIGLTSYDFTSVH